MINVSFTDCFWNSADKRWLFQSILKQRWSALVFETLTETTLMRAGFFKPILEQRWSAMVFLKNTVNQRWSALISLIPFWNCADQRWYFETHFETTMISASFFNCSWNSADESWFFETILTQRWSELVFWNPFSDRIDRRRFSLNPLWNNADKRWFFETILKQRWSALVFWTHSETALILAGFLKPFLEQR